MRKLAQGVHLVQESKGTPEKPQQSSLANHKIVRIGLRAMLTSVFVILIFLINFVIIAPIFWGSYTSNLNSFEGVLISEARFISHFFPRLSWDPLWHLGFPFPLFYTPLIPSLISLAHFFFSFIPFSQIYRLIAGIAFLASPLTLYLFVKYLSRKELAATLSALFFSGPTLISTWLVQRGGQTLGEGFPPWRFILAASEGQAAHLVALAIIPLAALLYLHTLRYPSLKYLIFTSLATALIALSNWTAFVGLLLFYLVLLFSEMILGESLKKLRTTFYLALLSYGLVAFWYNYSFLKTSYQYAQSFEVFGNLINLLPLSFVILPILATILFLIFDRRARLQPLFIGLVSSGLFFVFIGAWSFYHNSFMPRPASLAPELSMSLSILAAVILTRILTFGQRQLKFKLSQRAFKFSSVSIIIFIVAAISYLAIWSIRGVQSQIYPHSDIRKSTEFQIAKWLDQNNTSSARVYLAGSTSVWFNVFTDIPQVKGFSELGEINPIWKMASEEIEQGQDGQLAIKWLKALNVRYLVATPAHFRYFEKFEGLPVVKKGEGYTIYEIPETSALNSRVVDYRKLEDLPPPREASDETILDQYLEIIAPAGEISEVEQEDFKGNVLRLQADLGLNEGVLVFQTHHQNWRGRLNDSKGKRVEISSDPLGFILIKPRQSGLWNFYLRYRPGLDFYLGYGLTLLTLIFLTLMLVGSWRRKVWQVAEETIPSGSLIQPAETKWWETSDQELQRQTKEAKNYYQKEEDVDWVKTSDGFWGMESIFHKNRENLILEAISEYGQTGKYLDAGCGSGLILRNLPPGSVGLDINPRAIAKARKYAPRAELVVGDIEELPFPPNLFSNVICSEVFDRLPHPARAIFEIEKVLKPAGRLIGTVPRYNPLWRLMFLSSNVPQTKPYLREYTQEQLKYLLRDFEIIKISPALSNLSWFFVARKRPKEIK